MRTACSLLMGDVDAAVKPRGLGVDWNEIRSWAGTLQGEIDGENGIQLKQLRFQIKK